MRALFDVKVVGVVLLLGLSTSTLAQKNATLIGAVADSTGALIPGAEVTATEDTTKIATMSVTNGRGDYELAMQPGFYTLTVEAPGFQPGVYTNIELRAGQQVLRNFTLEVGAVESTVVVGTRARPRSVTESTVPVDVITSEEIISRGVTDLSNQLRAIVPSYNVNTQPISDAATISRPANLRNLAPDHALVLVNGKRRHRSAIITWLGNGVADGAQGPDIAAIPAIALRQVEVLRDGATAQYGSDAIAGVLNFLLKDARSGGSIEFRSGVHQDGGGGGYAFTGNAGYRSVPPGLPISASNTAIPLRRIVASSVPMRRR